MEFFATCPEGFERMLADELDAMGTPRVRPLKGQVAFEGELSCAYRVCLWSRLASRVVLVMARVGARDSNDLYANVADLPWEEHLGIGSTFAVRASGTNAQLRTTQFVAQRVKDAVRDRMVARLGARPVVNTVQPDVSVVVRISRDRASVGIDLAGAPLFERGYEGRRETRGLRPDYAAALLALGGWGERCAAGAASPTSTDDMPCVADASADVGYLLVEAALWAAGRAPGLLRARWGFSGWAGHDEEAWQGLLREASQAASGRAAIELLVPEGRRGASQVRSALRAAGVEAEVNTFSAKRRDGARVDLVACDLTGLSGDNLVRSSSALRELHDLAQRIQPGACAVAARTNLMQAYLGEPARTTQSRAGKDPVYMSSFVGLDQPDALPPLEHVTLGDDADVTVLVGASDQFAARLKKVAKQRTRWARREEVTCYRVYDADLPDYAVAIDLYQETNPETFELTGRKWLLIAEYAAPKGIDRDLAERRLVDVLALAPQILDVDPRAVYLRTRRRDRGGSQYADEARNSALKSRDDKNVRKKDAWLDLPRGAHLIDEGGLTFEVNFSTRLDCGIFLDHRDTRGMLREMAKQTKGSKRFLNLFAYTGTATCYAADGGMKHTTTVDLSRPSLDWARRNMARNGFEGREHEFVQADVVRWVGEQRHTRNRWDLIFCDVPTFSNSSRMGRRSFDVQRDHAELLIGVSRLLTRDGVCVFSCNLRTFKPDTETLHRAGVTLEDITDQTIPEDFRRNKRIHHTYLVRRGS